MNSSHGGGIDHRTAQALSLIHIYFPAALFNRGVVDAAIGRRTDAVDSFERFLKVSPHDSKAGEARTALKNLGA